MKIFTYAFNNPTYLKYQNKCLHKFIQEPFEHYCIDNASEQKYTDQFKIICAEHNIHYEKNLEPDHSLAGRSHYSALQWSWNNIISQTEEVILMLDHDTFPIYPVSITELLGDACLAGFLQARGENIEYFHPSCMIFNTQTLPNKEGSVIDDIATDIGGELCMYFRNNPDVKRKCFKAGYVHIDNPIFSENIIKKYGYDHAHKMSKTLFEIIEDKFFHARNGSGWDRSMLSGREQFIISLLDDRLNSET